MLRFLSVMNCEPLQPSGFMIYFFQFQKIHPQRGDSILSDSKEPGLPLFLNQGNHHVPRPVGSRSYSDSDAIQFEDRSLSKLKESDRCTATENLFLDTLSLDSPDDSDEPHPQKSERERFLTCANEVWLSFFTLCVIL